MLRSLISLVTGLGLSTGPVAAPSAEPPLHQVASLKITILSTMLADEGMGEWGFAALVEADGRRILFDTGLHPETVLQNARELGIDLSSVTDVVLSHYHEDHTGGLLALRRELSKRSPMAMSRIHVAPGIFLGRRHPGSEEESNSTIAVKPAMEATGAVFVEHREPAEIFPGVWLTGPVPRPNAERYWGPPASIVTSRGLVPDSIPENMSLLVNTDKGFVVVDPLSLAQWPAPLEEGSSPWWHRRPRLVTGAFVPPGLDGVNNPSSWLPHYFTAPALETSRP